MSLSRLKRDLPSEDRSFLRVYNVVSGLERVGLQKVTESGFSSKSLSFRNTMLADAFMSYGGGAVIEGMGDTVNAAVYDYCDVHGYEPVIFKSEHFMNSLRGTVRSAMKVGGLVVSDLSPDQFEEMVDYWAQVSQEHVRLLILDKTSGASKKADLRKRLEEEKKVELGKKIKIMEIVD